MNQEMADLLETFCEEIHIKHYHNMYHMRVILNLEQAKFFFVELWKDPRFMPLIALQRMIDNAFGYLYDGMIVYQWRIGES